MKGRRLQCDTLTFHRLCAIWPALTGACLLLALHHPAMPTSQVAGPLVPLSRQQLVGDVGAGPERVGNKGQLSPSCAAIRKQGPLV